MNLLQQAFQDGVVCLLLLLLDRMPSDYASSLLGLCILFVLLFFVIATAATFIVFIIVTITI
jgi:hypothetical protein